MRSRAGFHADEAGLQALEKADHLRTAQTPLHDNGSGSVNSVDLKPVLSEIKTDGGNLPGGRLLSLVAFS